MFVDEDCVKSIITDYHKKKHFRRWNVSIYCKLTAAVENYGDWWSLLICCTNVNEEQSETAYNEIKSSTKNNF